MARVSVLVLAAGKGVRMKSALPKVLHPVGGVPMAERVARVASSLSPQSVAVVVGHQGGRVADHLEASHPRLKFFAQKSLDGSGGAVRAALSWVRRQKGEIVVTCGDAPLLRRGTLLELIRAHRSEKNLVTVLTARLPEPGGYGRIVRGPDGAVQRIVEHLDATDEERRIDEINTGTYCFNARALAKVLPRLRNDNAKKEYYLTDALELASREGRIGAVVCADPWEALGVNGRADLAKAEAAFRARKAEALLAAGVTLIDPATTYVADDVRIGPDTVVWPQTYLLGTTRIGSGCRIGPWAHVTDCIIEDGVELTASFAEGAVIRREAKVGPYSRVRPGSVLGRKAHLGNFSEVKKAVLGEGSKANHLSYLGDATVGKNVNIGAGVITCNYDGVRKHPTRIEDHVFVGSNVNLIAPIRVGRNAVIGAGSSLSDDVPAWALALERNRPVIRKGWAKSRRRRKK